MKYRRMPIEIEAPEGFGYENIDCNLSESSFADQNLADLDLHLDNLTLFYGDHKGLPALRSLLAMEMGGQADEVLTTAGAAAALFIISSSLLEKGDPVVVIKPNYATNIETPRALQANLQFLHLTFEEHFELNLQALEKLIKPDTRLVSLTYPHNPTGACISEEELRQIIGLIEEKKTYLLMDETYREMNFGSPLPVAAGLSDRVISVSSVSKSFGLPGIRMGWIHCRNAALMENFLAAKEQIFITNSVVDEEIAYRFLLNKEKHLQRVRNIIRENFFVLKDFMDGQDKLEWVEPRGGCVCFPRIKSGIPLNLELFQHRLLHQYKTYIGRGHWFEEDGRYMRIGYSWDKPGKLSKGLENILRAIHDAEE